MTTEELAAIARETEAAAEAIFGPETGDTYVRTDYGALFEDVLAEQSERRSSYSQTERWPF